MLHPKNACRKHLILWAMAFYQRKKKSSIRRQWLPAKICRSCEKLTNYEHLPLSKTKKQTQVTSGFISPVHFVVAMENTSNPRKGVLGLKSIP